MIDEINGNILVVNIKKREYDLSRLNDAVVDNLKKKNINYEMHKDGSDYWTEFSYDIKAKNEEYNRRVYQHTIKMHNPQINSTNTGWIGCLAEDSIPYYLKKKEKEWKLGLIAKVRCHVPITIHTKKENGGTWIVSESQITSMRRIYRETINLIRLLEPKLGEIFPKGTYLLPLFDNDLHTFTRKQFLGYINRNAHSPAVGYTNQLDEK